MRILSLSLLALVGVVPSLSAQQAETARFALEGRVGYVKPLRDLGRTAALGAPATGYAAFGQAEGTPTFGLGFTTALGGAVSLRAVADYALETTVSGQWFCEGISVCPAVLQLVDGQLKGWSVGADLRLRLADDAWGLEPTVFLGVSRRSYDVRWTAPVPEVPIPTAFDKATWYLRPGLGLSRTVGSVSLFAEAEAAVGRFGSMPPRSIEGFRPADTMPVRPVQLDMGFTGGVRIPIG